LIADWIVALIVSFAFNVVAAILTPRPKAPKPAAAKDLEEPTAEAGRPIPRVFGRMTLKSPNLLWFGDKSTRSYEVKA
jgi:hypothetical protein